jgi:hypothetical protein
MAPQLGSRAMAVIAAARILPVMKLRPGSKDVRRPAALMYAYIVLSLLCGVRTDGTTGVGSTSVVAVVRRQLPRTAATVSG